MCWPMMPPIDTFLHILSSVHVHLYNTTRYIPAWQELIATLFMQTYLPREWMGLAALQHTIGTWFRLFAHEIVLAQYDPTVTTVLYMDADVVVTKNLEVLPAVWMDDHSAFQWGAHRCAGFMVLNLALLPTLWETVRRINLQNASMVLQEEPTDQLIFVAIDDQYPHLRGRLLPVAWDLSIANGPWRSHLRFPEAYPELGVIHYNGNGASKEPYWHHYYFTETDMYQGSLGLTSYYIHMPWT